MATTEGILGQDYWQSVKEKQDHFAAGKTGKWALNVVRPAIFSKKSGSRHGRQLRSTAYLDGLRGFAALLVYFGHHQLWAHSSMDPEKIFENVFGYEGRSYFATFHGVRIFFAGGHFSVAVFFVISGYVLSAKPLQYIHAAEHLKLGDNVASALFRRWLRLYLPVIAVTFLYMASWHVLGIQVDTERQPSLRSETVNWYRHFKNYSFLFHNDPAFRYSFHVWSLPTEFRGSIVIYTCLMALSRASRNARLWCCVALMSYFIWVVDGWYCAMFLMGMLQCDLDMLAAANNLPTWITKLEFCKKPFYYTIFAISIYLAGCPASSSDLKVLNNSPGWYYLSYLKPEAMWDFKWFYLFWAASMAVAAISRISILKQFFEMRFNQYLGRISFGFYLVHGPLIWTVSDRIYAAVGCTRANHAVTAPGWINIIQIPKIGPLGMEMNFIAAQLLILPITLWFAEMVTKLFDEPSVRFAQWLYRKATVSEQTEKN